MALSRLLLLCMVASEVWDAETKPIDFVCNRVARRALNVVAEMQSALKDCNGSMTLSTPVQLPCTELHVASWENKSHQEKRGDIGASLRLLVEGVKVVRALSQAGCGAVLLQRLEHNINNYLLILTHLQLSVRGHHCDKTACKQVHQHNHRGQWRLQYCLVFLGAPRV
ncbi:thrombopoietin isoform X3 [Thunnus thynnus]|uniref:thrombopoietin isoform X3 n=1 Tax=Thunnus thynnus TaxID=8237 RepID=UPI0035282A89